MRHLYIYPLCSFLVFFLFFSFSLQNLNKVEIDMGRYCFLIRRIIDFLSYKTRSRSKETSIKTHKQFFEIDGDQELFNDLGSHGRGKLESSEKSKLRDFSLELSSATIEL